MLNQRNPESLGHAHSQNKIMLCDQCIVRIEEQVNPQKKLVDISHFAPELHLILRATQIH